MTSTNKFLRTTDDDGTAVVSVPLGKAPFKRATMLAEDFDFLMKLGLSPAWNLARGYVTATAHLAPGGHIYVARVLLDASPGQSVQFIDGDPLNMRRANLKLVDNGGSVRRDRMFITPRSRQYKKKALTNDVQR
jgi:hypothetical protein